MIEVRRMRATNEEMKGLVANLMAGRSSGSGGADNRFSVTGLAFNDEGPLKIRVSGQFRDGRPHQFTLTAGLIIAAFVVFCNEQGVPMSRQSVKTVVKTRDGVAFDMIVRDIDIPGGSMTAQPATRNFSPQAMNGYLNSRVAA